MLRRPSAPKRLSELMGTTPDSRMSRLDHGRKTSMIPRPHSSLDRVSGVRPLDAEPPPSSARHKQQQRHRSADSYRPSHVNHAQQPPPSSSVRRTASVARRPPGRPLGAAGASETPRDSRPLKTPLSSAAGRHGSLSGRPSGSATRTPDHHNRTLALLLDPGNPPPAKDNRNINDPNWQKMTARKIINSLIRDKFNLPQVPAPLKPITIRTFLDITNHLLNKLGENHFQVDANNYVEKLPEIAKKLFYPGVITKSWLKSVNAMHTYPQMIAFLSYLVDLTNFGDEIMQQEITFEKFCGGNQQAILRHRYLMEVWNLWNFHNVEDFQETRERYIEELKQLYDVRDEIFEQSEYKLAELNKKKQDLEFTLEKCKKDEMQLQIELNGLVNKHANRKEQHNYFVTQIEEIKRILKNKLNLLKSAKDKTVHLQEQLAEIQEQIAQQKMTVSERNECLREIENTNEVIHSKEQLLLEIEKMKFQKDLLLAEKQKKAFDACIAVNQQIFKVGLAAGQSFADFSISERGLLAPGAIDDVRHKHEAATQLIAHLKSKLQEDEERERGGDDIEKNIERAKSDIALTKAKINAVEGKIRSKEEEWSAARTERDAAASTFEAASEAAAEVSRALERAIEERTKWENNDLKWREELEKIKGEEKNVRQDWETRVKCVAEEAMRIAEEYIKNVERNE